MSDQRVSQPVPHAHRVLLPVELQDYALRCGRCKQVFADQASFSRQHLRPGSKCRYRCTTELYARLRTANHPTSAWARDPNATAKRTLDEEHSKWLPQANSRAKTSVRLPYEKLPVTCRSSITVLAALCLSERPVPVPTPNKRWLQNLARERGRRLRYLCCDVGTK